MIGVGEYKRCMSELASIVPQVMERNIPDTLFYRNYLFSIDKGCGLTACLENMAEIIKEAGIANVYVSEEKLPADLRRYSHTSYSSTSVYKIECIDISAWMGKTNMPEFQNLLHEFQRTADKTIYVFRIPLVDDELFGKVHGGLSDVLFIQNIRFPKMSMEDMKEFAAVKAGELGFSFDDDAWSVFENKIYDEKTDGRFYGFNTVKKVVQEIVFSKLLSNAGTGKESSVITNGDFSGAAFGGKRASAVSMLDSLIGIDDVKRQVLEITEQIKYLHSKKSIKPPCIHMRFVGNPGTGKTTVARILGTVLSECGVLRSGGFFEYSGRDFIGTYIGETAVKTGEICRASYGSVLFIDEAYSLYFNENDEKDFGKEALTTLIAEMENHRSDMVVIMAGYPDEMDTLMRGNRGLESRMPYVIKFRNYTREELCRIFMKMAGEEFEVSPELEDAVGRYFSMLSEEYISGKTFSNARFVRNLYERTQKKTLNRCLKGRLDKIEITGGDFALASSEDEFAHAFDVGKKQIGF